jgi:pimeloyl-ACP methyl ester carboxylesterase
MTFVGPTSRTFISQRMRLHYVEWGNPDAPPLLLVHGGRDHCRSWDWVAEKLCRDWHIIAPDLRGHGDSEWAADGNYPITNYVYDLAQLIHQIDVNQVSIVAHSLGGNIANRYTGLYPDKVRKLVSIEGLGPSPDMLEERAKTPLAQHWREWIEKKRAAAGRLPRRYPTIDAAFDRMLQENSYLTPEQARHLTLQGTNRNEDGSWSWKFDPQLHVWPFDDLPQAEIEQLWQAVTCPTLLIYGVDTWASSPARDGRAERFPAARVVEFANAGHWPHHDQFDRFMSELEGFL